MKNICRSLPAVFIILSSLISTSCSKTIEVLPEKPVQIGLTADQTLLIGSENSFAFDIFKKVLEDPGNNGNIIISPLSISYALSMTLNGSAGATRDSIVKALRMSGLSPESINKSYRDLTEALLRVDPRVIMTIANSVWTEDDFSVKQDFINILTSYYEAESKSFSIDDPLAPEVMNEWIGDKTNGLIKEMVQKLEDNCVMLIVNAIYFKGKWTSQFDISQTENLPFRLSEESSVNVPMMWQKADFKVYDGEGFIIGEFPYGQGNFVMDVILPDTPGGTESISRSLTGESFRTWISKMDSTEVDLLFPRFKYGFNKKLKDILTYMGMGIAFTDDADLSNISEELDLLVNDVTHQAFIETNEEGTEAAAATIVDIGVTSVPLVTYFHLDHPFIYIIREITTNTIIFMGRVSNPSEE